MTSTHEEELKSPDMTGEVVLVSVEKVGDAIIGMRFVYDDGRVVMLFVGGDSQIQFHHD